MSIASNNGLDSNVQNQSSTPFSFTPNNSQNQNSGFNPFGSQSSRPNSTNNQNPFARKTNNSPFSNFTPNAPSSQGTFNPMSSGFSLWKMGGNKKKRKY